MFENGGILFVQWNYQVSYRSYPDGLNTVTSQRCTVNRLDVYHYKLLHC